MVNIKMFRHPKYYKELAKIRKQQAASDKLKEPQASSDKHQAPSNKRQASSRKLQAL